MKHCPECNFTFPDFHRVCDFDGTELVQDPERQSLMKVPKAFPHPRPNLKKPMLLTSLAVLGVFLSAVFIGHLESPAPSIPAIVKKQEAENSPPNLTNVTRPTSQSDETKQTVTSKRAGSRKVRVVASSSARLGQRSADRRSGNDVIARTQDAKRDSSEKSPPKVVAILKTTWRFLKKPFDF